MASRETPWPVAMVVKGNGEILHHVACDTPGAARKTKEALEANHPEAWRPDVSVEVRRMTASEMAYELMA